MLASPTAEMKIGRKGCVQIGRNEGFGTGKNSFVDRNSSAITITLVALVALGGDSTLSVPDDMLMVAPARCVDAYSLQVPVILPGGEMCSGTCQAPQCGTRGLG